MPSSPLTLLEKNSTEKQNIHRVCFVCTGNTCRSPMAAALYNHRHQKDSAHAVSAGLAVQSGAPIAKNAVLALRGYGVLPTSKNDYEAHIASPLTEETILACDEIFALSSAHLMSLCFSFPEHIEKFKLLGEIADPYGCPLEIYEQTLRAIDEALHG